MECGLWFWNIATPRSHKRPSAFYLTALTSSLHCWPPQGCLMGQDGYCNSNYDIWILGIRKEKEKCKACTTQIRYLPLSIPPGKPQPTCHLYLIDQILSGHTQLQGKLRNLVFSAWTYCPGLLLRDKWEMDILEAFDTFLYIWLPHLDSKATKRILRHHLCSLNDPIPNKD